MPTPLYFKKILNTVNTTAFNKSKMGFMHQSGVVGLMGKEDYG